MSCFHESPAIHVLVHYQQARSVRMTHPYYMFTFHIPYRLTVQAVKGVMHFSSHTFYTHKMSYVGTLLDLFGFSRIYVLLFCEYIHKIIICKFCMQKSLYIFHHVLPFLPIMHAYYFCCAVLMYRLHNMLLNGTYHANIVLRDNCICTETLCKILSLLLTPCMLVLPCCVCIMYHDAVTSVIFTKTL